MMEIFKAQLNLRKQRPKPEGCKDWNTPDLIHKVGTEFTPIERPPMIEQGTLKECFKNAFETATQFHDLIYCEGYADAGFGVPVLHAWVCHENAPDKAIEVTWPESGESYWGIKFDYEWVRKTILKKETWGVLDQWENGFPLLKGIETDFLYKETESV